MDKGRTLLLLILLYRFIYGVTHFRQVSIHHCFVVYFVSSVVVKNLVCDFTLVRLIKHI